MLFGKLVSFIIIFLTLIPLTTNGGELIQSQVRVFLDSKEAYLKFHNKFDDILTSGDDYFEILANPSDINQLSELGLKYEIIHEDIVAFYQSRLNTARDMGGYKTLDEINAYLDTIIQDYPDIVSSKISIGQTINGREMWAVKMSDNPEIDEAEPEILFFAAIHAREVITPEVLFYFMDYLKDNYQSDPEVTALIDEREIWFIPVTNPDGYYQNQVLEPTGGGMWRKNMRDNGDGEFGVDLNRNYGFQWGYDNDGSSPYTSSETYRGAGPFSEPEAQNMKAFIESREFVTTVSYHSKGNYFLIPYSYDYVLTADNDIFEAMADTIKDMNGYTTGTSWQMLGYKVNGGSEDWAYAEQITKNKNFAVAFEVGSSSDGFWPPLSRIPALVSENLAPNLFLTRSAGNIYQLRPPEPPQLTVPSQAESTYYEIAWSHNDTSNPAVLYELMEMQDYTLSGTDNGESFNYWNNNGFSISQSRSYTPPSSFYSGSGNNLNRYFQTSYPRIIKPDDSIVFRTWYAIEEDWDYAYVEISTDGQNFTPIAGNITTTSDPYGNNRGNGITGSSGAWIEAKFGLDDYINQSVYIRFSYETDSYIDDEGIYFDDIYPVAMYLSSEIVSSSIVDSFYVFTDKPTGTYYYRVRAMDAENQWGGFSTTHMVLVTEPAFTCADVNNDGSINIFDVTYLIAFLYSGGPGPEFSDSADMNNDGEINIFDITYLINWLYRGGPAPDCP